MKFLFTLLVLTLSAHAGLPRTAAEVEITKHSTEATYENFPTIKMVFEGERNNTNYEEVENKCRSFVMEELAKKDAKYFRVFCSRRKDVVMRNWEYTAYLLIKTWK
jgi:hypothetical protein